jgi:hypothetical protein
MKILLPYKVFLTVLILMMAHMPTHAGIKTGIGETGDVGFPASGPADCISPAITGEPASPDPVCAGTGAPSFTVTATGDGLTYEWQEYALPTGPWTTISTCAGVYSGCSTATLTITNPPYAMNGYKYRCIVSGDCPPQVTSNGIATLTVNSGPVTLVPAARAFPGIVEIPVTVNNFNTVGAISMTMNYDKSVLSYDSYVDNSGLIDNLEIDVSGTKGILRFSGTPIPPASLGNGSTLLTIRFLFSGGYSALEWNDSDDTWCEYAGVPPGYVPYCDDPPEAYYFTALSAMISLPISRPMTCSRQRIPRSILRT